MPQQVPPSANQQLDNDSTVVPAVSPRVTIFALPKPLTDQSRQIQHNAIGSWAILGTDVEVILIGDENGIAQTAEELGVIHLPSVKRNGFGTPLLSSAFAAAANRASAEILVYCNADVILERSFIDAVLAVADCPVVGDSFLAIGNRTDVSVDHQIDWSRPQSHPQLFADFRRYGKPASIVCKEYFAFRRKDFRTLPAFVVGRGNWDNWMVASAKKRRIPVVNLSARATVFHQQHHYRHLPPQAQGEDHASPPTNSCDRLRCYVTGDEARENQCIAGGKHVISGSTSTWRLTNTGVVKNRLSFLNLEFWTDIRRFVSLLRELFFPGGSL